MWAVRQGHANCTEFLLERGADTGAVDNSGHTAGRSQCQAPARSTHCGSHWLSRGGAAAAGCKSRHRSGGPGGVDAVCSCRTAGPSCCGITHQLCSHIVQHSAPNAVQLKGHHASLRLCVVGSNTQCCSLCQSLQTLILCETSSWLQALNCLLCYYVLGTASGIRQSGREGILSHVFTLFQAPVPAPKRQSAASLKGRSAAI